MPRLYKMDVMKMKKILIVFAAFAVLSCAKDPLNKGGMPGSVRVESLTARLAETKATVDDEGTFAWEAGDLIAVHRSESGFESSPLTAEGVFNVHLSGDEERDAFAVFPAAIAVAEAYTASNLKVHLPSEYSIARAGMALGTPAPMIAVNDPDVTDLAFRHIGGVLRLSLDNFPYETKRVVVNLGKRISGEFTVTGAGTDTPMITLDGGAAEDVVFNLMFPLFAETDGYTLNVPLPVGEYNQLTFTAYDQRGNVLSSHSDAVTRTVARAGGVLEVMDFTPDTRSLPLCLKSVRGSTVGIDNPQGYAIEYSTDLTTWSSCVFDGDDWSYDLEEGECIYFRGNNASYGNGSDYGATRFYATAPTYLYGNIMSLVDAENFATATTLTAPYTFSHLFQAPGKDETSKFKEHPSLKLELPATTLTWGCYSGMFYENELMTRAPALPATVLAPYCSFEMFVSCKKLKAAPALPAMTLAERCYGDMFRRCYALTTTPALPATTMAKRCYDSMFTQCWNLTTVSSIAATQLAKGCFGNMFSSCEDLTVAPALPCTTLAPSCYEGMFVGCKKLTQAPALPAETLANSCYSLMFSGCQSLTVLPVISATTLADSCYVNMFNACRNLETVPADYLPVETLAPSCYQQMFRWCDKLASAPALPATTLTVNCYDQMFFECPALQTAPDLPATTLAMGCYGMMFYGCTSLNHVKAMFSIPSGINWISYTNCWLYGVASEGTFYKNSAAEWDPEEHRDASGVPELWTVVPVSE